MIFETLSLLFKADTSDLQKNTKKATGLTDELKKSFKGMGDVSGILDESFLKLTSTIGGLIAAGLSAHAAYEGFKTAFDFSTQLSMTSRQMDVNVSTLQKWGGALEHYGGNAETFKKSIEGLSETFGLSNENAVALLPAISNAFQHYNQSQRTRVGHSYGLDDSLITLLAETNSKIYELLGFQQQLKPLTTENALAFIKFNDSLINSKQAIASVFTQIAIKALPSLTKFLDKFTEFATKVINDDGAIEGVFKGIAIAVGLATVAFFALNPTIAIIAALGAAIVALSGYFGSLSDSNPSETLEGTAKSAKRATEWFGALKDIIDGIVYGMGKIEELWNKLESHEELKSEDNSGYGQTWRKSLGGIPDIGYKPIDTATSGVTSNQNSYQSASTVNNAQLTTGDLVVNASNPQDANAIKRAVQNHYNDIFAMFKHATNQFTGTTL